MKRYYTQISSQGESDFLQGFNLAGIGHSGKSGPGCFHRSSSVPRLSLQRILESNKVAALRTNILAIPSGPRNLWSNRNNNSFEVAPWNKDKPPETEVHEGPHPIFV